MDYLFEEIISKYKREFRRKWFLKNKRILYLVGLSSLVYLLWNVFATKDRFIVNIIILVVAIFVFCIMYRKSIILIFNKKKRKRINELNLSNHIKEDKENSLKLKNLINEYYLKYEDLFIDIKPDSMLKLFEEYIEGKFDYNLSINTSIREFFALITSILLPIITHFIFNDLTLLFLYILIGLLYGYLFYAKRFLYDDIPFLSKNILKALLKEIRLIKFYETKK